MIIVNNFEITTDGKIAISVRTSVGHTIKSIRLWSMYDYKEYSRAEDISNRLLKINNIENIILEKRDTNLNLKNELLFMEVASTEDGCNGADAVTYNLIKFKKCLLDNIIKEYSGDCYSKCNNFSEPNISVIVSLLMETIEQSLDLGLYSQAIEMIEKLRKICKSDCDTCKIDTVSTCATFKQF